MSRFVHALLLGAAAAVAARGPVGAAPFTATLGLSVSEVGLGSAAVFLTGAGSGSSAPLLVTVPSGFLGGSDSADFPGGPYALHLNVTGNGPGSFSGTALKGGLPLRGNLRLLLSMATVTTLLDVALSIPVTYGYLGFGVGGTVTLPDPLNPNFYFLVEHRPWSEGPAVVTGLPYTYAYHIPSGKAASHFVYYGYLNGTAMYTGTDSRTPGGLGQITLVSPTKVQNSDVNLPFVVLGRLTLNFVPEPGTLVLLGAGIVGLALAGGARLRR